MILTEVDIKSLNLIPINNEQENRVIYIDL